MRRIFLLSPASCRGKRAERLITGSTESALAERLTAPGGAPLGEVFAFISSLYFRGKLTYARRFARPPSGTGGVHVITATRGLVSPGAPVTVADLREFAAGSIHPGSRAYRTALDRSARALLDRCGQGCEIVLLGSIASGKYLDGLVEVFRDRLLFPSVFVGRGDMSRGGVLLRAVEADTELDYVVARGSDRRGARPPRLPRR